MVDHTRTTTRRGNYKTAKVRKLKADSLVRGSEFDKSKLLIPPLVIAFLCCVYAFIQSPSLLPGIGATLLSPSFGSILITPPLSLLLVTVFCCFAIYLLLTNRRIGKFAILITWLLAALEVCFLFAVLLGIGRMCGELTCTTANTFSLSVIFLLNPFAELLWNILATIGIILLVRKLKQ